MSKLAQILATVHQWASQYQPAVARTLAAAFFQMLVGLGIVVGDWPDKVNAVLGFVAILTTVLAGRSIKRAVYAPATHHAAVHRAHESGFAKGRLR